MIAKERDAATTMQQRLSRDSVQNLSEQQIIFPGNPAIHPKDAKSYFLRIPLELRYMNYHYALSYEEGFTYK
jgi:hypothetical protein